MHIFRFIRSMIETIVVLFFVMIAVLNIFSSPNSQGILGYRGYTVISASMEPALMVGDYIVIHKETFDTVKPGDIISYREEGMIVTHRVIEKKPTFLHTKGDNNSINDTGQVTPDSYLGSYVIRVPFIGHLLIWLQTPLVFALVIGLLALRLAILIIFKK